MTLRVRVVGRGRAGGSFAGALRSAGWFVDLVDSRNPAVLSMAADDVDLVLICVTDAAVEEVARAIPATGSCVVAHCAGSLGLEVLGSARRRAAIHPLVSLPTPEVGAARLPGAWFGVAADPAAGEVIGAVVAAMDGRSFEIDDGHRALYHAAACVASNHVVALLGQVERVAAAAGAPVEAYLDLVRGTIDNVSSLGPRHALTGPAARGDDATIERHRVALRAFDDRELPTYDAMVREARRLAGRT